MSLSETLSLFMFDRNIIQTVYPEDTKRVSTQVMN